MTAGILGGAFDPPHVGHVALARAAIHELGLDKLLVVVVGEAPHKVVVTDAETRFRLAEAAFSGIPAVELSRHELDRPGPSYTVETARWARRRFGDDVLVVIGGDEFADFLAWHDPDGVLEQARVAVAARPGYERERLDAVRSRLRRPDRVAYFPFPEIPVASREIRARVASGEPIDELVPPPVAMLVRDLGLYRGR
ncbi:MAG: nicotinate (nicotinamide) nucleotide adenylyltransferase [Thermoleophilia bacterium]|nr:nicotinate (nicotinamide) nucleotide adenylyltransferase [Thermoleophilia bacterium]